MFQVAKARSGLAEQPCLLLGEVDSAKPTGWQSKRLLTEMPRIKIGPAQPERKTIDIEIARLRDLSAPYPQRTQ
jgi:hypothetical protein